MTSNTELQPELKELIEKKAIVECGETALLYSSTYISQLNNHINSNYKIAKHEIEKKVNYLAGCLTLTLDHRLEGMKLLRARLCEGQKFENIDDLSYIKQKTDTFPQTGRLNQAGKTLFYASVDVIQDDAALRVVLSEVGAKKYDQINVLRSHQALESYLNLRIIGIWDQVRRDDMPYYLDKNTFTYYKNARAYMTKKFDPKLLSAYELTDRFFADILSRKGSTNLYQVTSVLGSVFLTEKCDGLLYSSVEAKGEPVVALIPSAVDGKLEHKSVCDMLVEESYGYEFFAYKTREKTSSIDTKTGRLNW